MPENVNQLPKRLSDDLDRRLDDFDTAWADGSRPEIESYIPKPLRTEKLPPRPEWRRFVAELLSIDLEHRLRTANPETPPRIEDYYPRIPWLADDDLVLLELIPTEYMQRHQHADAVTICEYEERFPQLGAAVTSRLSDAQTELVVENSGRETGGGAGGIEIVDDISEEFRLEETDTLGLEGQLESDTQTPESHGLTRSFGNYELQREIARGGMGIVYKAIQRSLKRTVALKVILAGGFAQSEDVRRFQAEAEAAARLDHPNIVPIFEVGQVDGHHFFSMAYVKGPTLSAEVASQPLEPTRAALVMRDVAGAIQYAHENDVIHRDLKPSNIMLEDNRTPRVTDFGLARQTNVESGVTVTGQVLGTPSYMPPEQALGYIEEVDARSDVYSLGATLYFLITGRPPFHAASVIQTLAQVVQEDPLPPRRLNNHIPRDLENICLKCLNKSPEQRYQSAADLQADLDRFLGGIPTIARPLSSVERLFRHCRRRPGTAALIASVVTLIGLLLMVGSVAYVMTRQALSVSEDQKADLAIKEREARDARDAAQSAQVSAEVAKADAIDQRNEARQQRDRATAAEQREKAARERVEAELRRAEFYIYLNALRDAQGKLEAGQVAPASDLLTNLRRDLTLWNEMHGWEYDHLRGLLHREQMVINDAHQRPVLGVCWSPDGTLLASCSQDRSIKVWDRKTSRMQADLQGHTEWVRRVGFVGDKEQLLSISHDGTARLWSTKKGVLLSIVAQGLENLELAAISANGQRWAWGDTAGQITVYDLDREEPLLKWQSPDARITAVTFDSTGELIATADAQTQTITIRPVEQGRPIETLVNEEGAPFALAFSNDGKRLAASGGSDWVQVWDIESGRLLGRWTAHQGSIYGLQFGQDPDHLVTSSEDQTVRLWSISRVAPLDIFPGHRGPVFGIKLRPGGDEIVSAGADGTVRIWRPGRDQITLEKLSNIDVVQPTSDGTALRFLGGETLRQMSFDAGVVPREIPVPIASISAMLNCSDEENAFVVAAGRTLLRCDGEGQQVLEYPTGDHDVKMLCRSWQGNLLASTDTAHGLRLLDATTGELVWERHLDANCAALCFTEGDRHIMAIDVYGAAGLYETASGEPVLQTTLSDGVRSIAASPRQPLLAVGENNGLIRLYHAEDLTPAGALGGGHQQSVNRVAFSPDGERIASVGADRTVRIWATDQQSLLLTLSGHEKSVVHVFWTNGGRSLVSVDLDGKAIRWRTHDR